VNKKLVDILDNFAGKKILVLGDIMLDKYIWGTVSRISPEAPVPIVLVKSESFAPGGAANVANNISELGGLVTVVGVIGNDDAGKILSAELQRRSIVTDSLVIDMSRPTVQKMRLIGHNQQLLRLDYEKCDGFGEAVVQKILHHLEKAVREVDAVVVSDYAKGVVNKEVMEKLMSLSVKFGKKVIGDPKPKNRELFRDSFVILPNHIEANQMASIEDEDDGLLQLVGMTLVKTCNCNVIITRGEKGLAIFSRDSDDVSFIPTLAKEVYDVTGAGDTVTGTLAMALAAGADLHDAALIANHAAGIVVGKVGTATVNVGEIRQSLEYE
jgi:rfaE bifunctional protein kinase chain/domain